MTEMVLQNGGGRVGLQLKSLFRERQGVSQEKPAENALLEVFRMGWDALSRTGKKSGVSLSETHRETANIRDQYSIEMIGYTDLRSRSILQEPVGRSKLI
jgi:hypothetical protein